MPKTVKKSHHLELGDRVIYTKNNRETECWVHKIDKPYIVLRQCFKSSDNILIHQVMRDAHHHIRKFKGRKPKLNQLVLMDNFIATKGIIIDISTDQMTIQIIGTRVNYTVSINCCSVTLLDKFNHSYIPYFPINLKTKAPFLYKDVMIREMRGTICDYDEFYNLYLFLYWENGIHKIKWIHPSTFSVEPKVEEDIMKHVYTYELEFNSVYHEKNIDYILNHAPDLLLIDFMKNMSWWNKRNLQKLLEMYFVNHYRCKKFNSHIKIDFLDQHIMEEMIKHTSEEEKIFLTHQYMSNVRPGAAHNYKFFTEMMYRSKPYFDLKLSRRDGKFIIDVFFNQSLKLKNISPHINDHMIKPIVNFFNPTIQSKFSDWEDINTTNIQFWEEYWGKQQIEKTNHPILFPHQLWAIQKMEKMEKNNISNIFNFNVWGKKYNILSGFNDSNVNSSGGILALDTGLGKTICCIELIKRNPSKTLIVVPLTLLDQWKMEIKKYYPEASVSEFYGKNKSSEGLIVLTTYGTILQNISPSVDRVIFDECHTLKSCYSSTTFSSSLIKASKRWCVTATPFANSLESIQPYLKILNVYPWKNTSGNKILNNLPALGYLMDQLFIRLKKDTLTQLNLNPIMTNIRYKHTHIDMHSDHKKLYDYLHHEMKTKMKELMGYPRNFYKIMNLYNQLHMVAVDPKILDMSYYAKTIEGMKKQTIDSINTTSTYEQNVVENFKDNDQCCVCICPFTRPTITPCFHVFCYECITTAIGFSKKCPQCRAPLTKNALTEMVKKVDIKENKDTITFFDIHNNQKEIPKPIHSLFKKDIVSNKMVYMIKKIKQHPTMSFIIFSQFNICLYHIKKELIKQNISVDMINGKKTRVQRKKAMQHFKEKKIQVFLLSTKTASIGLTLTTSYHMFFMEPILDTQVFNQATGRVFRIGQTNNVTIETLYSKNTIEQKEKIDRYKKNIKNKKNQQIKKLKMAYLHNIMS